MTIFYSEQAQTTDFITIKGIRTRLGLEKRNLGIFTIRELIDNALDIIEQNAKEFVKINKNPYIDLIISEEEENGKVTKITVRNSNPVGIDGVFTEDQIEKIFNFDNYYSNKRNQYHLSRGALGGAFKEILGIPYALAVEGSNNNDITDYEDWKYPLQINILNKRLIEVRIEISDKIRKKIKSKIEIKNKQQSATKDHQQQQKNNAITNENDYTEITIYIPTKELDYKYIDLVFKKYILQNTHIDFKLKLADYNDNDEHEFKATQNIKDWKNKLSIYYYSLEEFKDLIRSFESSSDSLNVYGKFIHTDFREGYTLEKTKDFETLTFGELKQDDKKIEHIYQLLKRNVPSIRERQSSSLRDLELPFDIKQNIRSKALCERFEQIFGNLDSFAYKRIDGYFGSEEEKEEEGINNNPVEYPFIFEIFLVETSKYEKRLHLFPSVNLSPSMYSDSFDDEDRNNKIFTFKTSNNNNNDTIESSHAITDILSKCGYNFDKKKHRKSINFVFINLISPRIEYKTGGKINLELKPFGSIAQELYKFCKSPNIKGKNNKKNERPDSIRQELKYLLEGREFKIKKNPDLKRIDRWTQSTVFYRLRPILINKGYRDIDDKKRKYITKIINSVCEELGYTRDELGIIAAERAQLYFKGQTLGVGFDQLKDLMEKGTDLLIIEKEGVADVLAPFAEKVGIAILNSRGFLTEYATELSRLAKEKGCNIAILTDLDSSGLIISTKLPNAHRIGIDLYTLFSLEQIYDDDLTLDLEDVEENVILKKGSESDNHLKSLKKYDYNIPSPYNASLFDDPWEEMVDYLDKGKRIEIDAVLAKVGSERFWNFILNELEDKFQRRNYNRSIDVPEYVPPKEVDKLDTNIKNRIIKFQAQEREKIIEELKDTEGFLDIKPKEEEIKERLRSVCENNIIKKIISEEIKKFSFDE